MRYLTADAALAAKLYWPPGFLALPFLTRVAVLASRRRARTVFRRADFDLHLASVKLCNLGFFLLWRRHRVWRSIVRHGEEKAGWSSSEPLSRTCKSRGDLMRKVVGFEMPYRRRLEFGSGRYSNVPCLLFYLGPPSGVLCCSLAALITSTTCTSPCSGRDIRVERRVYRGPHIAAGGWAGKAGAARHVACGQLKGPCGGPSRVTGAVRMLHDGLLCAACLVIFALCTSAATSACGQSIWSLRSSAGGPGLAGHAFGAPPAHVEHFPTCASTSWQHGIPSGPRWVSRCQDPARRHRKRRVLRQHGCAIRVL